MDIDLRPASVDEADAYYALFSSAAVCRYTDLSPFDTWDRSRRFLEFADEQSKNRRSFRHSIWVNGEVVGTTCLYSFYWHQKRASLGYALREAYWKQGIMGGVLQKIEEIAKSQFDVHRLQATVVPENTASKRLLEKSGFDPY